MTQLVTRTAFLLIALLGLPHGDGRSTFVAPATSEASIDPTVLLLEEADDDDDDDAPFDTPIYCWHVHVYFLQSNNASTSAALALRDRFLAIFAGTIARAPCAAEVTLDAMCLWGCQTRGDAACMNLAPQGPHTLGSWGASMTDAQYNDVLPWVLRAGRAAAPWIAGILVHPLTAPRANDTAATRRRDHEMGLWTREVPLDYGFLAHNRYDCDVCDPRTCTQAC